jgi:plastocyanin
MRKWWALGVAATFLVAGAGVVGCGDDGDSETDTAASAPPVSLAGQVTDHGTTDLGDATELDLELDDQYFAPTFIEAPAGTSVKVTLENEGDLPHTFTIDDAGIDQELQGGATATVDVTMPDSGSLAFYCRFHVSAGMQGAFVVSAAPASSPGTTVVSGGGGSGY